MKCYEWDIICRVVDNFGDAGIAWRLAKILAHEHGKKVTLWIDRPDVLARLLPELDLEIEYQTLYRVNIQHLTDDTKTPSQREQRKKGEGAYWTDVIVDMFGGGLPKHWLFDLKRVFPYGETSRIKKPVIVIYEYLSAEDYVDSSHGLASPPTDFNVPRFFFFPGFTEKSGGLLRESDAIRKDQDHELKRRRESLWASLLPHEAFNPNDHHALWVSLFCYQTPQLHALIDFWRRAKKPILVFVPETVASYLVGADSICPCCHCGKFVGADSIRPLIGKPHAPLRSKNHQGLMLKTIPFVSQSRYDDILAACDRNIVRGEDSLTRALWAGQPFLWQAYLQPENAHHEKARALIERYAENVEANDSHREIEADTIRSPQGATIKPPDCHAAMMESWGKVMRWLNGMDSLFPEEAMLHIFFQCDSLKTFSHERAARFAAQTSATTRLVQLLQNSF